jgi:hypothetical protein
MGIGVGIRVQVEVSRALVSCRGGTLLPPPCHAVGSRKMCGVHLSSDQQ